MARLPRPKLPSPGGLAERIRAALARLRYALGDLAYLLGRGIRAILTALGAVAGGLRAAVTRVRGAWAGLSVYARRRIVASLALAAAVAVFVVAALPNLPCEFPGGDACPPPDDAAELVPADALAYVHANLDSQSEQMQQAAALADRLPGLTSTLEGIVPVPGGIGLEREVLPWLGGEAALAVVPVEGGRAEQVLLFEVGDEAGAQQFERRLPARRLSTTRVGDFLAVGSETALEGVTATSGTEDESLADSPLVEEVGAELPEDSFAQAYVSAEGARRLLGGRGGLSSLGLLINPDATLGAGAAVVLSPEALELHGHSDLDPERLRASPGFFDAFPPFDPTLTAEVSPDALAYLGLGDPEATIGALLAQAHSDAPGLVEGFEDLEKELLEKDRLSLTDDLLPTLGGQAAFAIEAPNRPGAAEVEAEQETPDDLPGLEDEPPGVAPPEDVEPPADAATAPGIESPPGVPYLSLIADGVDESAARESLARLQAPLARELGSGDGQPPAFERIDVAGVSAETVRASPAVNLTFAVFDGLMVISSAPAGLAQVREGEGSLEESDAFRRATADFPGEPALVLYLNLGELVSVAEGAGLSEDPAYAAAAPELRQLGAAALSVEHSAENLDSSLRVTLDDEPSGGSDG